MRGLPLVIAHRGDSARQLENSLEAIGSALSLGVDMIEIDIRMGRDGALFVMHDKRTGRTAGEDVDIERSTADEIARVRLVNGEPVPTLAAVLDLVAGRAALDLEIKGAGAGEAIAKLLRASGYAGEILVSSFRERELLAVRRAAPELPLAGIFKALRPREVAGCRSRGYRTACVEKGGVTGELVAACLAQGVRLFVWTVDDEEEMRRFIAWGVDGICTNRPAVLREVMRGGPPLNLRGGVFSSS